MKSFKSLISLFAISCLLVGCIEEIPLETDFKPQIFVTGYLVNTTDYISVDIQNTVPLTSLYTDPVDDAQISLYTEDSDGNAYLITDDFTVSHGRYTTFEKVTTIIGNHYWIEVNLSDGTKLKSAKELLKETVPVLDIIKENGKIRVVFNDPVDDDNFYQINFKIFENGEQLEDIYKYSNDALYNGKATAHVEIENAKGDEIHVNIMNVNYGSYQFYINADRQYADNIDNDIENGDIDVLFKLPTPNLKGNISNTLTKRTELGNFAVFSYYYQVKFF